MPKVLLGLGSNLGDREAILNQAVDRLREVLDVVAVSSWFTYPAVGGPDGQGDFLNGAVVADTSLSPSEVHQALQAVEQEAGRERIVRWSSRTLDCDLLLYGEREIWTDQLKVPHPRMITRKFVLEPANEIACDMMHPTFWWTIGEVLHHLRTAVPYFCVLGSDRDATKSLSRQISESTGCLLLEQSPPFSGSSNEEALEWSRNAVEALRAPLGKSIEQGTGCVGSSWVWEPWLLNSRLNWDESIELSHFGLEPKLAIITDDKSSHFGELFSVLDEKLRIPTLFLSQDPKDAVQDAVGAVLSMMM